MHSTEPKNVTSQRVVGWREWVMLPALGIEAIKAKVDTGARTSTLHTFQVETFQESGVEMVRFAVHPLQKRQDIVVKAVAPVHDIRWVRDSGGHRERRIVILTQVTLGNETWPIEVTLTDRDTMLFRMLLGRCAISGRYLVDTQQSYLMGDAPPHSKHKKKAKGR